MLAAKILNLPLQAIPSNFLTEVTAFAAGCCRFQSPLGCSRLQILCGGCMPSNESTAQVAKSIIAVQRLICAAQTRGQPRTIVPFSSLSQDTTMKRFSNWYVHSHKLCT